jgi:acyl carrier protein
VLTVTTTTNIKNSLKEYFQDNLLIEFDQEIGEDTDLFKAGVLDSFGYIQLIKYVQQTFEVKFSSTELMKVEATLNNIADKVIVKILDGTRQSAVGEIA